MIPTHFLLNFLNLALVWDETLTLSLILFSTGLICVITAILLAIYLLKSDRFTTPSEKGPLLSHQKLKKASHLLRLKKKMQSVFKRKKSPLKSSEDYDLDIKSKDLTESLPEPAKDDLDSSE